MSRIDFAARRQAMVAQQIEARGITDPRVLAAMREVPREDFVSPGWREEAYHDGPLPIEAEQTISQPYIVALMCAFRCVPECNFFFTLLPVFHFIDHKPLVIEVVNFQCHSFTIEIRDFQNIIIYK